MEVIYVRYFILNFGVSELFKILRDEEICGFDRSVLYSIIPFNLDPWLQTLARLPNILNYWTVPILTKVLAGNVFVSVFRLCVIVSYIYMIIQKLGIFYHCRPNYGFSFRTHWCKPLIQHLVHLH